MDSGKDSGKPKERKSEDDDYRGRSGEKGEASHRNNRKRKTKESGILTSFMLQPS